MVTQVQDASRVSAWEQKEMRPETGLEARLQCGSVVQARGRARGWHSCGISGTGSDDSGLSSNGVLDHWQAVREAPGKAIIRGRRGRKCRGEGGAGQSAKVSEPTESASQASSAVNFSDDFGPTICSSGFTEMKRFPCTVEKYKIVNNGFEHELPASWMNGVTVTSTESSGASWAQF
ncbi:hypothetical protein WISP_86318 [Willisornis vidua]|uniref:Uncharacterized protein n=1 Tax=Willisornis vidua TaxID=1566151 RepID=A0ABQ9D8A9_9PASS|nr:hypothetical protein WISP_86318 [Willisornis vidua]